MAFHDQRQMFPDDNTTISSGISAHHPVDDNASSVALASTSPPEWSPPSSVIHGLYESDMDYAVQQMSSLQSITQDQHGKVLDSITELTEKMTAVVSQIEEIQGHQEASKTEIEKLSNELRDYTLKQEAESHSLRSLIKAIQEHISQQHRERQELAIGELTSAPLHSKPETADLQQTIETLTNKLNEIQKEKEELHVSHQAQIKSLQEHITEQNAEYEKE